MRILRLRAHWLLLLLAPTCLRAQIADGSFESGEYAGWTAQEAPGGQANRNCGVWGIVKHGQVVSNNDQIWDFADGGYVVVSTPALPATFSVTEGRFAAVQLQRCPLTTRRISQVVTLATGAARLAWDMQYRNHNVAFIQGVQDIQVTVRNAVTGAVLPGGTIFRTREGVDPPSLDTMTGFSVDISAFAGQTVTIAFDLNANVAQTPFKGIDTVLDNVRIVDANGDEIPGDHDADGVRDDVDNCRTIPNPTQDDFDGDTLGDLCDNCRKEPNPGQEDTDADGVGNACESNEFQEGDIYFRAGGYPLGHYLHDDKATRVIVRMDPFSGRRTIFHNFEPGVGVLDQLTYDPSRKSLILKESATSTQFFKFDAQGVRTTFPVDWPHSVFLWTPTGDGRLYMIGLGEAPGRPFGYIDESGRGHDLLGLDGDLFRIGLVGSSNTGFIYDVGTDSLFLAQQNGANGTLMYKLPLSPDGSRLRAPMQTASSDIYPPSVESPVGMSAGPGGSMFVKLDVNANITGALMFTVDPVALTFGDFATVSGITGASGAGTYSSLSGRAMEATGVINTQFDTIRLRTFQQAAGAQAGDILAEYSSGFVPTGVNRMISIGDTINRTYRLTLELDGLQPGGSVFGIAGEKIRLHGTALLRASHPGASGWTLGIRAEGANASFGFDPCDEACASALTFFGGDDEVSSNATAVVGSGIVGRASLRSGVALGSRRVKLLRFWVDVTVPQNQGSEPVRLFFEDGLMDGGDPVANSLSFGPRIVTTNQGLFLGDVSFRVTDAELLPLPAARQFSLTPAEPIRVFRLEPPAVNALLLRLTDADSRDANALYFSQGRSLIPGNFELAADERFRADQRLAAWTLRNEPVFIECRGTLFPGGANSVELAVEGKEVALESLSASRGSGRLTAAIKGAGFAEGTQFRLLPQAGGAPLTPESVSVVSSGRAEASFVLNGAPGTYDLRVDSPGGASDVLASAFELLELRIGPVIEARLTGTRAYRYNRESRLTLEYRNSGDQESAAPLLKVVAPPGTELRLERDSAHATGELLVLGTHPDGVAGTLPPGGEGRISINFRLKRCPPCAPEDVGCPNACEDVFDLFVMRRSSELIAWSSLPPQEGMDETSWSAARPGLFLGLGATWARYGENLAELATRLSRRGVQAQSVLGLFRFAVREALGRPSSAVTGRLTLVGTGAPLAGATIVARRGGVDASSSVTDALGEFAIDWLVGGQTYQLGVAGHAIAGAPGGVQPITMPAEGDLHRLNLAVLPAVNHVPGGCASCDETHLPTRPLFPPAQVFERVTQRPLRVVNSWDPNDKNGSDDLGDPVPPDVELEYAIYFENLASDCPDPSIAPSSTCFERATAPAQEIVVTDWLDPQSFDLDTFQIRDVRLGVLPHQFASLGQQAYLQASGYTASPSADRYFGRTAFQIASTIEDSGEVLEFLQEISVSWQLNHETGDAVWRIRTNSSEALVGVLPVNDASGRGEGHVSFTVKPISTLNDGSELENQAEIVFDDNPAIQTQVWTNTIQRPPLEAPALPRPEDGAVGVDPGTVLQWSVPASSASFFDVFLWRQGDSKPAQPLRADGRYLKPARLEEGVSYLWQSIARKDPSGSAAGPTWRFTVRNHPASPPFIRGDANADGESNIADASYVLRFLFTGGPEPPCLASADANSDGDLDVSDAIASLLSLFVTGAGFPPPYPDCGTPTGPREDVEECGSFPLCE